ncbi:unnamed protein product, partial [Trypanosoma congolense IL3000]
MFILPPFKRLFLAPEEAPWVETSPGATPRQSRYMAKELEPAVAADDPGVLEKLITKSSRIARGGRPVLIIVESINEVHFICQHLKKTYPTLTVYPNTGETEFALKKVGPRDVIVATNIAGRGADYEPTREAEENGGLHVAVGFMPENIRVERQNAGRTSRQGRRGTVQLFFKSHSPGGTADEVFAHRDRKEKAMLQRASRQIEAMNLQDRLLQMFSALASSVLAGRSGKQPEFFMEVTQVRKQWNDFLESRMFTGAYDDLWEAYQRLHASTTAPGTSVEELKKRFHQEREEKLKEKFRKAAKRSYADDVVEEAFTGKLAPAQLVAEVTEEYEGKALKERFALWLETLPVELEDRNQWSEVEKRFKAFAEEVRADAKADGRLIRNPHYYIRMGNELMEKGKPADARKAYDAAIRLDPDFCYLAHYYKGMAILRSSPEGYDQASEAFQSAQELLDKVETADTNVFITLLSKPSAQKTVRKGTAYFRVYVTHRWLIEKCIETLEQLKKDNKKVEVKSVEKKSTMEDIMPDSDDPMLRDVLDRLRWDGLQELYMLQERKEIPWGSIGKLFLLAAGQLVVGAFLMHFGAVGPANAFIQGGISDFFQGLTIGFTREEIDWENYGVQKAAAAASYIVLSGVSNLSQSLRTAATNMGCPDFNKLNELPKCFWNAVGETLKCEFTKQFSQEVASVTVDCLAKKMHPGWEVVEPVVREAVQTSTQKFLDTDSTVQLCIEVDVYNQTDIWEYNLREEAEVVGIKVMHTTRFVVSEIPGADQVLTNSKARKFADAFFDKVVTGKLSHISPILELGVG